MDVIVNASLSCIFLSNLAACSSKCSLFSNLYDRLFGGGAIVERLLVKMTSVEHRAPGMIPGSEEEIKLM